MTGPAKQSASQWISEFAQQAERGLTAKDIKDPVLRSELLESAARAAAADRKVPFGKRTALKFEKLTSVDWKELSTGHKVNAGISGACAVMAAFSTVSAAKNSVGHDEEGKAHIQWSNVGIALLEATVAAGCAFFTVEALHGRSPF